jgi:hypothetical protein
MCPGQQFAHNGISYFLIRFVQNFSDMEIALDAWATEHLVPGWKSDPRLEGRGMVRVKSNVTPFIEGRLWVRVKDAVD